MNSILHKLSDGLPKSLSELARVADSSESEIHSLLQDLNTDEPEFEFHGERVQWARPRSVLSPEKVQTVLNRVSQTNLSKIQVSTRIDSTNRALKASFAHGKVVLAEQQTAGRGRLGRSWHSPLARNIYLSLGWKFDQAASQMGGLSLLTGIAVAEALRPWLRDKPGVKWPNDLYLDKDKLGGILIELVPSDSGIAAIIGIGINVNMGEAAEIDQDWTSVERHLGESQDRNQITAAVLNRLVQRLLDFPALSFERFNADWGDFDMTCDKPVTVISGDQVVHGTGAGISEDFCFLLRRGELLESYASGDVKVRLG